MSSEVEELAEIETVDSAPLEEEAVITPDVEALDSESQADEITESGEKAPASEADSPAEDPKQLAQGRINKLIAKQYKMEGTIAQQAEELRKFQERQVSESKEPTLEDFNYDSDAYKNALIDYGKGQVSQEQNSAQPQAEAGPSAEVVAFTQKTEEFKSKTPDFVSVVADMPIEQHGIEAIIAVGDPAVTYYLGTHLDALDELNRMSPAASALRVRQLSETLKPIERKLSSAPDPVGSVNTGGSKVTKDPATMSVAELDAYEAQTFVRR